MIQFFTTMFSKPSAQVIIQRNLADYKRELITAEASAAYSTKLAEFYRQGITRLQLQANNN